MLLRLVLAIGLLAGTGYARAQPFQVLDTNSLLNQLFDADDNRAQDTQVTINYQNMASKAHPDHDNAPNPLFTLVDATLLSGPTYASFNNLVATFTIPDSDQDDPMTSARQAAASDFIEKISTTKAYTIAWTYLQDYGHVSQDPTVFKQQLSALWFTPYARGQATGSSGFESVFVGETQANSIIRGNNWLGFYLKEKDAAVDYHGWFTRNKVGLHTNVQVLIRWNTTK
ncbi:unnamed protein product, partial [Mesorhabditis spiculigera]